MELSALREHNPYVKTCERCACPWMTEKRILRCCTPDTWLMETRAVRLGEAPDKVFVDYFSRALNAECQRKGVTVQCVMPLLISTNMTENIKTNILVKTAEDFAREALNTVGLTSRTSGCLSYSIQSYLIDKLLPESLANTSLLPPPDDDQNKLGETNKPKNQ